MGLMSGYLSLDADGTHHVRFAGEAIAEGLSEAEAREVLAELADGRPMYRFDGNMMHPMLVDASGELRDRRASDGPAPDDDDCPLDGPLPRYAGDLVIDGVSMNDLADRRDAEIAARARVVRDEST